MANQYEQKSRLVATEVQRVLTFKRRLQPVWKRSIHRSLRPGAGMAFLTVFDDPNRSFPRAVIRGMIAARGSRPASRCWAYDLPCRIERAMPTESNPRFFKAENVLAQLLAHGEISLRDALYIKALR
jgi:hypothetical protein